MGNRATALALAFGVLFVAGCGRASIIVVEVSLTEGYDGAGIVQLRAVLALDDDTARESFPGTPQDAIEFPATFGVSLARDRVGTVTVDVEARDDLGAALARGSGEVDIDQHHSTLVEIELMPFCGNGVRDAFLGEECDAGPDNDDSKPNACRTTCEAASCGDGVRDSLNGEACDDGIANSDTTPDACRTDCTSPACGDGVIDTSEACDDGAANSDTVADACRTDCTTASCGDGVIDTGEQCDAGAANSDTTPDACRTTCVSPACGDAVLDPSNAETCDDGNLADGDQCGHSCQAPPALGPTVDLAVDTPPYSLTAPADAAVAADFDGDGLADLAFASVADDTVYVVLGVDLLGLAPPATIDVVTDAAITLNRGVVTGFGSALAAGDADGDGLDDLLVGETDAALLVLGSTLVAGPFPAVIDLATAPADVTVTFPAGEGAGTAVALGDLNGDTLADLIVGSPLSDPGALLDAGRVDVLLGRDFVALGPPLTFDADTDAELRLLGAEAGDELGGNLATGDFDGDLTDDLAAAARGGDGVANAFAEAGEVYLMTGRSMSAGDPTLVLDTALGEYELLLAGGPDTTAYLGDALTFGDLDGDGLDELVASAPQFDPAIMDQDFGLVVAVIGRTLTLGSPTVFDLNAGGADVSISRSTAGVGDLLGASLAAGDANNDGLADLLIGEPNADLGLADAGAADLWLGRSLLGAPLTVDLGVTPAEVVVLPEAAATNLGNRVILADVNDDGFADLVIGSNGTYVVLFGGIDPTP